MDGIANWVLAYAGAHLLASLVIVPVAFLALRMRAIAPEARTTLLLVAFVLVVLGPAIALQANVTGEAVTNTSGSILANEPPAGNSTIATRNSMQGEEDRGITITPMFAALLLASWLAGMILAFARLLGAHAGLRRIVAASHRSPSLEKVHRQAIPAGVEILVSPMFGPATIGIVRPRIVLPQAMAMTLPTDVLRAVLLHESTHHRRRDVHALLVQRLVEAVFWWDPLVRLLGKASDAAREVACDIGAARAFGNSTGYAEALLDAIAHFVPTAPHADARALCAGASLSTLDRRIDAIIEAPRSRGWTDRAVLPGVGGVLVLLCIGASIAAPGITVKRDGTVPASSALAPDDSVPPTQAQKQQELLALQDRHSQFVHASQDLYSQSLARLTESYTRELSVLAEEPPDDGKEARLEHLNAHYLRLFSDNETSYRMATAQAEAQFLSRRSALAIP